MKLNRSQKAIVRVLGPNIETSFITKAVSWRAAFVTL